MEAVPPKGRGKHSIKILVALLMRSDKQNEPFPSSSSLQKGAIPHISLSLFPQMPDWNAKKRQGENVPAEKMRPCRCWGCWQIMPSLQAAPSVQTYGVPRCRLRLGRGSFEVFAVAICILGTLSLVLSLTHHLVFCPPLASNKHSA